MSSKNDQHIWYLGQVIAWQPRLYAFVLSLTGNPNEADDVLQNTNVALLEKQEAFRPNADFAAWALQIAHYEVQRHRDRRGQANRRFDDQLLDQLAARMSPVCIEPGRELVFLRECMALLSDQEREMIAQRYGGHSVRAIAERWGRPASSISQTLYRVRSKLAECVKRAIQAECRHER